MNTNDPMIQDYDAVLDARYGKEGTPERVRFEEDAYAYYTGLILRDARKEAKVSQAELARRTQTTKYYISRICGYFAESAARDFGNLNFTRIAFYCKNL